MLIIKIMDLNEAVFTSQSVLNGAKVRYIYLSQYDETFEFESDYEVDENQIRIVSLDEILKMDPSLVQIVENLKLGQCAYLLPNNEWVISEMNEEDC